MRLNIHWKNVRPSATAQAYVERRLRFALGRLTTRISRVLVKLKDLNGPRGGVDKSCQLVVSFPRSNPLIVEHRDASWLRALDLAAERLAHAVRRTLKRRFRNRRDGAADKPARKSHKAETFFPRAGGDNHVLPGLQY
jgi:ribosome-associated translation inhibitor RaiA